MLNTGNKILLCVIYLAILIAAVAGCGRKTDSDKLLASVSEKEITLKDFEGRFSKLPSYYQDIVQKNRKRFLDDMIVEMIFYEEARRKRLDEDKEVKDVINEARKKILVAKLIKNEVEDKVKVKDGEALKFYEAHKEDFKSPELWRASHILVATEKDAKDVLAELAKGADFGELAKARSTDATASRFGDIGYFKEGQLVPEFEKACLKLGVGETSGIVQTQFGYHVIRLTDKKVSQAEPFDKVKDFIEGELKKKKRSELFDKLVMNLKEKYKVKIEEDVLVSLESLNKEAETQEKAK